LNLFRILIFGFRIFCVMSDSDIKYWVALNSVDGLGPVHFNQLLKYFGDVEMAWNASVSDLKTLNFSEKLIHNFLQTRKNLVLESIMKQLNKLGVKVLTISSSDYPPLLKQIYDPPPVLYVRGRIIKEDELAIAVVGSRRMTRYGQEVTENLVQNLVAHGLTIVSGLAFGVDIASHQAALDAGGRVIAVLASGVDIITPTSNTFLAERILKEGRGAIISEHPLGTTPLKHFFPVRNRIISGLALGTLVVEATEKSGTAHTARAALEQGREVFAVPGSIFSPLSIGTHNLIKSGAKLVNSVEDILEELQLEAKSSKLKAREVVPETPEEDKILKILGNDEVHVDQIIQKSKLPTAVVTSTLTMMEMKGKVRNLGNQVYRVAR
jgi:DNA processing protein